MTDQPLDAKAIFNAARGIVAPEERLAYLVAACGHDAAIFQRVQELLRVYDVERSFLEAPPVPAATSQPPTIDQPLGEGPGTVIGPYKLLEQIGEGGFGIVYLAEQTQPVRRKVAFKVLKPGLDSRQVVARFEAERQALAIMDHPNIAKVFDGGTIPAAPALQVGVCGGGRPYFVMEYVKGVPITDYCDQNRLTPRERLELFVQVCQAVQHAHQKGIIHRDLKPSNVLVSRHDVTPVPKVIDFGIAKALGQELTDKTLFTGVAQMIGTPLYVSPEQAGMSDLDVDTRSDVYSLGVLLYELLTGTTPFTRERFHQAAFDEMRRIIQQEEPPKPSTRLSTSESLPTVSALRGTEPAKLTKLVRGELDWIVMKCLEKDRNRRYQTANGLALDLQRYLADEPVEACPPSAWYRFGKFARRNKAAIGMAGVVTLAGLALLAGALWHNLQLAAKIKEVEEQQAAAQREARRADGNFAKTLEAVDKFLSRMGQERLAKLPGLEDIRREVLEEALAFFQGFLEQKGDEPTVRWEAAGAYFRMGLVQNMLGRNTESERSYRSALELLRQLLAENPRQVEYRQLAAACQTNLAILLRKMGREEEAETLLRESLGLNEGLLRDDPGNANWRKTVARAQCDLATVLHTAGKLGEAEALFGRAVASAELLAKEAPNDLVIRDNLATACVNCGRLLKQTGRLPEGEKSYRRAVELFEGLAGDAPHVAAYREALCGALLNLGVVLDTTQRSQESEECYRRAVDFAQKLAAESPAVPEYRGLLAKCRLNLAALLAITDRLKLAEAEYQRLIQLLDGLVAEYPGVPDYVRDLAGGLNNHGKLLFASQRMTEAEAPLRRAVDLLRDLGTGPAPLPGDRLQHAMAAYNFAVLLENLDRRQEAEEHYRQARRVFEQLIAEFPQTIEPRHVLGAVLNNLSEYPRERGELGEARALLEEAIEQQKAALHSNPRHPTYREFLGNHYRSLVEVLIRQGELDAAVATAAEAPRLYPDQWEQCIRAAEFCARCIPLAEKDTRLVQDQRDACARRYGDQALTWLRDAAARGCKDLKRETQDPAFDALRGREDFQKLIKDSREESKDQQPAPKTSSLNHNPPRPW